ncbi:MAG: hypothetical protein M3020_28085 [Myxococcota bacterium]|nr:hypothetical protein [Myxococcota bacterium]
MHRSWSIPVLALSLGLSLPRPAFAQTQAENIAAARALGIQGVQLADDGKCAEAIPPLERAEALYHAPSILGRLGECQVAVGQLVLGTENLNRTVREPLAPNAPQAFRDAQARAQKVLDAALPRIAKLLIRVSPEVPDVKVRVGDAEVPAALLGAERPTDPGTHQVSASAPGYLEAQSYVTLTEGGRQELTLSLVKDPNAVATPAAPATAPAPAEPAAPISQPPPVPESKPKTAAYLLLGVGAAGLVTGSVTGLMALSKKNDLDCPDHECPPGTQQDNLDSAKSLALVSTIGFGVGVAGAVIGTILLVSGGSNERPQTAALPRTRPYVRGNTIGLEGSF